MASQAVMATHLVGGEIYYDHLGNNSYKITLIIYRDCGPSNTNNTQFDTQAKIGIFNNGILETQLSVPKSPTVNVPISISNPCLVVPPSACIEEARYITTVNLPPKAGGYDIVYQRCCRNPSTMNILTPADQGSSYLAHIPEGISATNSSPRFMNYPPTVLCVSHPFTFDHSAMDPDGDSLVYELCTPFNGAAPTNPAPNPVPPPFTPVPWGAGYSNNNQVTGNPTLSIDPVTGELSGQPTLTGIFTFGVCVKEYRNGVLLDESRRDFQFYITNCDPVLIAGIPDQTDSCADFTVQFTNNSIGSSFYLWDFGDGTTSTDVHPTHTYPGTGTYTVMLIANPGWPCADTAYSVYEVREPLFVMYPEVGPQCIINNSFNFHAMGNFGGTASFHWDFGPMANPQTSTGKDPIGIQFLDSGHHIVSVIVDDDGCFAYYEDTVIVFPELEINFGYPEVIGCQPYTVQFYDSSVSWTPLRYVWDFGTGDTSHAQNPVYIYPDPGTYDVSLTITADSGCAGSLTMTLQDLITVLPSPTSSFEITPGETDVFEPFFSIVDYSWGDVVETYYITGTGDTMDYFENGIYTTNDTGYIPITQWVYNSHGCPDTTTEYIYIRPVTTVYAPNAFTPDGDGVNDVWLPVVRDVYDYELRIFTRWGQQFFFTEDQYQGWDGTFKGQLSPDDVYVYQITYRKMNKIREVKTGHFTLLR